MVLLPMEKLTLSLSCRGQPSFIHTRVLMEPAASQLRLAELLFSIKMAAGLWMVAPVNGAGRVLSHRRRLDSF